MNKYAVVMAGGGGTRFWPLSRLSRPKQMLNLSGNDILINETIKRNSEIIPIENIYIVTGRNQEQALKQSIIDGIRTENILYEPVGRNTSACIGYAAAAIHKRHGESLICVFPSDAYIDKLERYKKALTAACQFAGESNSIITIGIKPTYPATGYGYIKSGELLGEGVSHVDEFVEKPCLEKAKEYIKDNRYFWNCGIFVFRTSVIMESYKRFLPKLYHQLETIKSGIDTPNEREMIEAIYPRIQNISIDYGIMERSDDIMMVPGEFEWNDIGTWDALGAIFPPDDHGNIVRADHIGIGSRNSIIYSNKLIATIGVENMIIIDTDDATLVCPKNRAQEVKDLVEILKRRDRTELT